MRYASVCDGIGAAHVAWRHLGWECAWTSEIEPFPATVVDHQFAFKNVGDMTKITEEMLNELGPVELLVGGTPCQSFSVAGLRGGLDDPRGNLALRFVQLAAVLKPEWIVWENVPGVLSSSKGRDFGTFLGALAELGYGFAYRVLDAQWFGVAQRRRRVFVVGHARDWRCAAAVLFERESVFGDSPTRGEAGQEIAGGPAVGVDASCRLTAFHPTQDPISSEDGLVHALGTGSSGGCATAAVAFSHSAAGNSRSIAYIVEGTPPLRGGGAGNSMPAVAIQAIGFDGFQSESPKATHQATVEGTGPLIRSRPHCVATPTAVRRLTPRECERLQGFPDDYTLVTYRNKPAADGPRYKALGNSMAVPVMRWIGERISMVSQLNEEVANGLV